MALISLEEAKGYLRVDTADEDAMIGILISAAERLCADVARLSDEKWEAVCSDTEDTSLLPIRETMKVAILYALGYLFEHREEADHHDLVLTLTDTSLDSFCDPGRGGVMNIAGLRVRITIQKNETVVDKYGNHKSSWTDYFTCWATAVTSGLSTKEEEAASHTVEADRLDFTVRYSSETAAVNSKQYRILLGERIYNIQSIDEMGFKHNSRKIHTELSER